MKCINNKIRTKKGIKYGYCTKYKKEVPIYCKEKCIEYKKYSPIKKRTSKLNKLEKNRFSILTDDLEYCIMCGKKRDNLHEVFFGRSRLNSIKYGMIMPLCSECHRKIHLNGQLQDAWHIIGQKRFEEVYPDLDFLQIFGKNYIKDDEK